MIDLENELEEALEEVEHYSTLAAKYYDMLVQLGFCPTDGESMPCMTCGAGL